MLEIISWFIIIFVTYIVDYLAFGKILKQKITISKKEVLLIFLASIINCYFQASYTSGIRMIVTNLELVILLKMMYNQSVVKALIATLFIYLGYAISEVILAIGAMILNIDMSIFSTLIGMIFANVVIMIIFIFITSIKPIQNIIYNILNWYKDNEFINNALLITIAFITFFALTYPISIEAKSNLETITYILVFVCTIVFVSGFFKQKTKSDELRTEYDHLLDYVKVYEKEVNEKSKSQHEYKNQLIILRDMIKGKNKSAEKYISNLLEDNSLENDKTLLEGLQYIPDGGLKGLIYFKLSNLKSQNCEIHILVDKVLENPKLWKTCIDNLADVSKVIGVFLDNAIEALESEKEKYLIIDVEYEKGTIIFKFSNTCTKHIDFNKIDVEGYTTKGKSHGYGLSLVKDIVDNNSFLENKREKNGQFFVQYLYIHKKSR